jgi:putative glutamine amidotransferase
MPLIAVTACAKPRDYEAALRRAGAGVRVVAPGESVTEILAATDGVLLTGGGDVDPAFYGELPHPSFSAAEPGRDQFEIALARQALAADLPLFAICRGIQVLNVALGGTLVQDVPDQRPGALGHRIPEPPASIAHDVAVTPGSLLESILGDAVVNGRCPVNSRHHQAVNAAGRGLIVTAVAADGIVEAVEDPTRRFCLGVQWHPENFHQTGEFASLFAHFTNVSGRP